MVELKLKIPDSFYEEEDRNGYVVSRAMKEVWAVELDLLTEFDRVCKKYSISYIVSAGTMLGAVRHKGFIPWDDDIDVMMMRDQYEIFCAVANIEFKKPYFFQSDETDPGFMRRFSRIRNSETTAIINWEYPMRPTFNQGVFIDIFPIDSVTPNEIEYQKQCKINKNYLNLFSIANTIERNSYPYNPNGLIREVKKITHLVFGSLFRYLGICRYLYSLLQRNCQRFNNENCEYVSPLSFQMENLRWMIRKSSLANVIRVPFEFIEVPIIKDYDEYLRNVYGDYMTPTKAPSCHGELIFDTNQSYIDFYANN